MRPATSQLCESAQGSRGFVIWPAYWLTAFRSARTISRNPATKVRAYFPPCKRDLDTVCSSQHACTKCMSSDPSAGSNRPRLFFPNAARCRETSASARFLSEGETVHTGRHRHKAERSLRYDPRCRAEPKANSRLPSIRPMPNSGVLRVHQDTSRFRRVRNPHAGTRGSGRKPPVVSWFGGEFTLSPHVRQTAFTIHPLGFSTKRIRLLTFTMDRTLPSERPSQDGRERSLLGPHV